MTKKKRKRPATGAKVLLASLALSGILLITNQLGHQVATPAPTPPTTMIQPASILPVVISAPARSNVSLPVVAATPPPTTAPAPAAVPVPATTTKPSGK